MGLALKGWMDPVAWYQALESQSLPATWNNISSHIIISALPKIASKCKKQAKNDLKRICMEQCILKHHHQRSAKIAKKNNTKTQARSTLVSKSALHKYVQALMRKCII